MKDYLSGTTNATLADVIRTIVGLINSAMPALAGIVIIVFFIGLIRYIYKAGDAKGRAEGRFAIIWGLIGIFVIFSLWGIINLLQGSLLPSGTFKQPSGGSDMMNQNNPYPAGTSYPQNTFDPMNQSNPYPSGTPHTNPTPYYNAGTYNPF